MEEARLPVIGKRRTKLVLNNSFGFRKELMIGDTGQLQVSGILQAEKINELENDRLEYIKTFLITGAKLLNNKRPKRAPYDNE